MKILLFFIISFITLSCAAQNLSSKKVRKLYALGVNMDSVNTKSPTNQMYLNLLLKKNRKKNKNKVISLSFLTVGLFGIGSGVSAFINSSKEDDSLSKGLLKLSGTVLTLGGTISCLISMPFNKTAKKRRKERDKLINRFISPR